MNTARDGRSRRGPRCAHCECPVRFTTRTVIHNGVQILVDYTRCMVCGWIYMQPHARTRGTR